MNSLIYADMNDWAHPLLSYVCGGYTSVNGLALRAGPPDHMR